MTGTWFGNFDADITTTADGFETVRFQIDRDGFIDGLQFNGTGPMLTASPAGSTSGLAEYVLSDGRELSIYLGTDRDHFAFVIEDDNGVGVVERTPAAPPPFFDDDIIGTYIGIEYAFTSGYVVTDSGTSQAVGHNPAMGAPTFNSRLDAFPNCDTHGTLTGGIEQSYGVFEVGTYTESTMATGCLADGDIKVYLSPDTELLLAVTCESFAGNVPEDCRFGFFERP